MRPAALFTLVLLLVIPPLAQENSQAGTVIDRIGLLQSPTRLALSDDGELYVADTRQGVVAIYDVAGVRTGTLRGIQRPIGVALAIVTETTCTKMTGSGKCKRSLSSSTLRIYVADQGDGSVRYFDSGVLSGALGAGAGEFARPNGIATTSSEIYVVDSGADRVMVYGLDGTPTRSFGGTGSGPGRLDFPTDVVVDGDNDLVYVTDLRNKRIVVFDATGTWSHDILPPNNDAGDPVFLQPAGIGMDPAGRLYVVDNALMSVAVLETDGSLAEVFGYRDGAYWTGELRVPIDAATDGERLYVTSSLDGRVHVFEVAP